MKWVGSLGLIKYNADAKNRPEVESIFGWFLMIISEEVPDFLKEWLLVGWHFGRSVIPW